MRHFKRIVLFIFLLVLATFRFPAQAQFLPLKFDHITSENGLPHNTIHGIAKDKYGFMWFGTWSGLCRYDGYEIKIYRYDAKDPKSIANNRIHNLLVDSHGDLWIASFNDQVLSKYNYLTDDFTRVPYAQCPEELVGRINRSDHRYRVKFQYGQTQWNLDNARTAVVETFLPTGAQKIYTEDPKNPWSINDAYISDVYLDDQHVLWLGSYSHGINRSYLDATPFHDLIYYPESKNSLADNTIRSLCEDLDGNLWVGTRSKGITLVRKDGSFQQFFKENQSGETVQSNYIKRVFADSYGYVWIGSGSGLDRYDPHSKRIETIDHPFLKSTGVYGLMEDKEQNIWLATWKGLGKWNRKNNHYRFYELKEFLEEPHLWTLMQDKAGNIWVASEGNGIFILKEKADGKLQILSHLQHEEKEVNTLSDNRVYSLFEDKDGMVWIGTGNGLDIYNPRNKQVKSLSNLSNLWPKGTIAGISQDHKGYIWVSHKQGLSRIDKNNMLIRTFSETDGLLSNDFVEGAIYHSKLEPRIYLGSNYGVCHFSPDSVRTNRQAPKVLFTDLHILNELVNVNDTINNRVVLSKPLYLTEELTLTHADKSISISFAALHFANPTGNKYAYMLEGFDADWIYTDANRREVNYSNLSPGSYSLKVKASNSDGVWTVNPTVLRIEVLPPWWASGWAYLFYALAGLGLLYIFNYYSTRFTRLKSKLAYEAILHEKEIELQENKLKFFTNISHEIKTPLTLILSPIQQLKAWAQGNPKSEEQLAMMENNGDRLLRTVNQLLDFRRLESGQEKVKMEETDLLQLIQRVIDSFRLAAKQKEIQLKFIAPKEPIFLLLDYDKLEKVLYNLLSNALKFTTANGLIKVRLKAFAEHVEIDVLNDGPSIEQEDLDLIFEPFTQGKSKVAGGTGLGLTYSRHLIQLLGGQLFVRSRSHASHMHLTVFRISLPKQALEKASITEVKSSPERQALHENIEVQTLGYSHELPLSRKCSILLVEDNVEMNNYLADFFRSDYVVLQAFDGEEGLEVARDKMPDLIISDVMMPKIDGLNFTQQIKSDALLRHIPVLLLTARSLLDQEMQGLAIGADDYLVKPFQLPILALKVKNQLLLRLHQQEQFQQKLAIEPSQLDVQSADDLLLQKVFLYIEEHMSDSDLKIDHICQSVGLSRAQLYRKMNALTGMSMADMIKEFRLKRAQQLLKDQKLMVSEVGYLVGYSDPEYFRKSFKAMFGYSPSEFAKKHAAQHINKSSE